MQLFTRLGWYVLAMAFSAFQVAAVVGYQYFSPGQVAWGPILLNGPFFFVGTAWIMATTFELFERGFFKADIPVTLVAALVIAFVLFVSTFGYVGLLSAQDSYGSISEIPASFVRQTKQWQFAVVISSGLYSIISRIGILVAEPRSEG